MVRGYVLVLVSAVGFGVTPLLATAAYRAGVDVPTVLLYRFAVAAVVLWTLCAARGACRRVPRGAALGLVAAGTTYCLQAATYFFAVQELGAGLAVLLLYLYPSCVAALSALLARTPPSRTVLVSLVLSFVGIGLALGDLTGAGSVPGLLSGMATAACYTTYVFLTDRVGASVAPLLGGAWVCTVATVVAALHGVATGTFHPGAAALAPGPVVGVGLAGGAVAILCFYAGVAVVGATQASLVSTLEPVVAVVGAGLLLGEHLVPLQWLGTVLVLVGAGVAVLRGGAGTRATGATVRPARSPRPG